MNPSQKVYFLSDFHLGAKYFDNSRQAEKRIVEFLDKIKDDASEIYLLGDILDYWFEYKHVVPRGFVRFFGKIAELADNGIKITWIIGNHDIWIFDYIPSELGITIINGSLQANIMGKEFFLSHGDNVGKRPLGFRVIRSIFHNKLCQKMYSAIHPRWTIPFALGWSKTSREKKFIVEPYKGIDNEPLMLFAQQHALNNKVDYYIFGHRHILIREKINNLSEVIILGEWINLCSYALFDGKSLSLHQFKTV